jgi:putative SOS response-associated peptidase YedK
MCGRFTQHNTWQQIHQFLSVIGAPQNLQPRYNIAPTTLVDMVRHDAEGHRERVRGVRWGPCTQLVEEAARAYGSVGAIRIVTRTSYPVR